MRYKFFIPPTPRENQLCKGWPKNLILAPYPKKQQQQLKRKIEAFERFVILNATALALLQLLSLEMRLYGRAFGVGSVLCVLMVIRGNR